MSGLALGWTRKRRDAPSREAKALLMYLADNANEQTAWPSKRKLALDVMCSEKTIMRLLADLVEARLLIRLDVEDKHTGRTRTCGYYFPIQGRPPGADEIAAFELEVGGRVTRVSPWEGDTGVPLVGDMGVTGRGTTVSPLNEPPLEPSGPEGPSPGGREREALVRELEEATPPRVLAVSDQVAYREAVDVLAERGVDLAELPGCMRRMAVDPLFLGKKIPDPLERWLLQGKYRGYPAVVRADQAVPEPAADATEPHAAADADRVIWRVVETRACEALTEKTYGSWIRPARLCVARGELFVVALTGTARDWIAGNCWRRIEGWWSAADAAKRPLKLVSRLEFEALLRQTEGVD